MINPGLKLRQPSVSQTVHSRSRARPSLLLAAMLVTACGCSKLTTEYGKSGGIEARRSLNGFAGLRQAYEQAGFRQRDVYRLSDRVMRHDVIVWTPQILMPIESRVTGWFDRWLRRQPRTLVYVVPDSGSEADYWIEAAALAPPEQRLEYRRRAARAINRRMVWRNNRAAISSNGWFHLDPLLGREPLESPSGPWAKQLKKPTAEAAQASGLSGENRPPLAIEFELMAFDSEKNKKPTTTNATGPTGPGAQNWWYSNPTTPTSTEVQFEPLLSTENGKTLVARVTSERWHKGSQVLVVAGGSLLTNYALSRSFNRRLADALIAASKSSSEEPLRAGFLTSDWMPIPISERKPGVPVATGMELLTVWPLSLVTMHGLMLGIVICLMLLPIFGRPRRVVRDHEGDFGHHLDAVASLMNRAGGEAFARARISEYMKRMHGETSGRWVLPETTHPNPATETATTPAGMQPKGLGRRRHSNADHESPKETFADGAPSPDGASPVVTSQSVQAASDSQPNTSKDHRLGPDNEKADR